MLESGPVFHVEAKLAVHFSYSQLKRFASRKISPGISDFDQVLVPCKVKKITYAFRKISLPVDVENVRLIFAKAVI